MAEKTKTNESDMGYNAEVCKEYKDKVDHMYKKLFMGNGESIMTQISKNIDFRLRVERITENLFLKIAGFMLVNWIVIVGAIYFTNK